MKEKFKDIAFRSTSLAIIAQADQIIREYQGRGFTLTLRQLYYQFVSRDLLPNTQAQYKRLGGIVNDARIAGKLDWSAIEDRDRNVKKPSVWSSPEEIIRAVADQYREDPWITQKFRPEVWIEKSALIGVIEGVCKELQVPYFACKGYVSQSEMYDAGKRFAETYEDRQTPLILHLGDHDPSGLDMTRDLSERLSLFAGRRVEVRRLALSMAQIDQYDPPPNPAKETDARFVGYQDEFGDSCWELDALDPEVISNLIREELVSVTDLPAWFETKDQETLNRRALTATYRFWPKVSSFALDQTDNEEEDDE